MLESAHIEPLKFAGMEMNQHFWQNIGHSVSLQMTISTGSIGFEICRNRNGKT
jgi:hypothetical protein